MGTQWDGLDIGISVGWPSNIGISVGCPSILASQWGSLDIGISVEWPCILASQLDGLVYWHLSEVAKYIGISVGCLVYWHLWGA